MKTRIRDKVFFVWVIAVIISALYIGYRNFFISRWESLQDPVNWIYFAVIMATSVLFIWYDKR